MKICGLGIGFGLALALIQGGLPAQEKADDAAAKVRDRIVAEIKEHNELMGNLEYLSD